MTSLCSVLARVVATLTAAGIVDGTPPSATVAPLPTAATAADAFALVATEAAVRAVNAVARGPAGHPPPWSPLRQPQPHWGDGGQAAMQAGVDVGMGGLLRAGLLVAAPGQWALRHVDVGSTGEAGAAAVLAARDLLRAAAVAQPTGGAAGTWGAPATGVAATPVALPTADERGSAERTSRVAGRRRRGGAGDDASSTPPALPPPFVSRRPNMRVHRPQPDRWDSGGGGGGGAAASPTTASRRRRRGTKRPRDSSVGVATDPATAADDAAATGAARSLSRRAAKRRHTARPPCHVPPPRRVARRAAPLWRANCVAQLRSIILTTGWGDWAAAAPVLGGAYTRKSVCHQALALARTDGAVAVAKRTAGTVAQRAAAAARVAGRAPHRPSEGAPAAAMAAPRPWVPADVEVLRAELRARGWLRAIGDWARIAERLRDRRSARAVYCRAWRLVVAKRSRRGC